MSTTEKKQAFLDNYKEFGYITNTCRAIGVSYSRYYEWMSDESFSSASSAIKKEIDNDRLDRYEAELDKRVLTAPSKQSDILLMFGLKALKPDVYREKVTPLIGGDIKIIMAIPGYDEGLRLTNTIDLKKGDYAIQGETQAGKQGLTKEAKG